MQIEKCKLQISECCCIAFFKFCDWIEGWIGASFEIEGIAHAVAQGRGVRDRRRGVLSMIEGSRMSNTRT